MDNKKIQYWIKNEKKFKEDLDDEIGRINEKIVEKKFSHTPHGYDPEEVDKEIDVIIKYYEKLKEVLKSIFDYTKELDDELNKLKNDIKVLKEKNEKLVSEGYGNFHKANGEELKFSDSKDDKKN